MPAMPPLSDKERAIIIDKATEPPFSGIYTDHFENGVYVCRQCGAALYNSKDKFPSHCGWRALMMRYKELLPKSLIAMASAWRFFARAAGGIWGIYL